MKRITKTITALFLALVMLCSSTAFALTEQEFKGKTDYRIVSNVASVVSEYYKFGVTPYYLTGAALYEKLTHPDGDVEDMISAMLSSLDKHSSYLTGEEYKYMMEHTISGEFAGIGVSISRMDGRIVVISPIVGSPAEEVGIRPNDIIATVNGEDVLGATIEYVQSVVTGEIGTTVNVGILRGNEMLSFDVVRAKISETTVSTQILDDNIGYMSVSSFSKNTAEEAKKALEEFDSKGVKKLIIDVRNNPGGELTSAVNFCGLFVPKGVVAHINYKNPSENELFYSQLENPGKYDIAVLVNDGSASAAELFSGSVQDTKAGTLFGVTTYGKGTVQTIMPYYPTGGALRITIAEYLTAGGRSINEKGVTPDYTIENETEHHDTSYFAPVDVTHETKQGDNGKDVLALEQRLEFLGYFTDEADECFDEKTADAVETYQAYRNLSSTGTADINTLMSLNNIDYDNLEFTVDRQLEAAKTFLLTGNVN